MKVKRVLWVSDLWPTEARPGEAPWIVEPLLRLRSSGVEAEVVYLRRVFPSASAVAGLFGGTHPFSSWRRWSRETRSPVLHPGFTTEVRYTSPPRARWQHTWAAWAWRAAARALRESLDSRRPDVVAGHFAVPSGEVAVRAARAAGIASAVHVHGADLHFTARISAAAARRVSRTFEAADVVIANSRATARGIAELAPRARVEVLWQAGDVMEPRQEPAGGGLPRVVSVGHLEPHKGFADAAAILREARARGARFRWAVVGAGTPQAERELAALIDGAGLGEVVELHGELPHGRTLEVMRESDIFLLPAWRDAYGVVFAEALGAGLAVFGGSSAGAIEDFARAGAPVESIDPGRPVDAGAPLAALLGDRARLAEVRQASREWAGANLGWDRYCAGLLGAYEAAVGRRSAADREGR